MSFWAAFEQQRECKKHSEGAEQQQQEGGGRGGAASGALSASNSSFSFLSQNFMKKTNFQNKVEIKKIQNLVKKKAYP